MLPEEFINTLAAVCARVLRAFTYVAASSDREKESRRKTNPCEARIKMMESYKWKLKAIREIRR